MRFEGAEQAVRFSYNIARREIASRPSLVPTIHSTSQEGLSPHELHAQGALIQQAVSRLPRLEQSAVRAFLAPEPESTQNTLQAIEELWPLVQGRVPSKNAAYDLLRVWLGRSGRAAPALRRLAAQYKVTPGKLRRWRDAVSTVFAHAYLRGIQLLEADLFREDGLELKYG